MKHKPISKKIRVQVYQKYNGHCAYCGCEMEYKDMQVDHIESVYRATYNKEEVSYDIDNLNPACRACNFYKSTSTIEKFRQNIGESLIRNLQKNFNYKLLVKYGLIKEDIKPVKFYFENKKDDNTETGNEVDSWVDEVVENMKDTRAYVSSVNPDELVDVIKELEEEE